MTNVEYLIIMHKRAMEKAITKAIRETCHKEREENRVIKSTNYLITDERTSQCVVTRIARIDFEYN
jgi:hypothetical protein